MKTSSCLWNARSRVMCLRGARQFGLRSDGQQRLRPEIIDWCLICYGHIASIFQGIFSCGSITGWKDACACCRKWLRAFKWFDLANPDLYNICWQAADALVLEVRFWKKSSCPRLTAVDRRCPRDFDIDTYLTADRYKY